MISPTGKGLRSDSSGDGRYGSPRGKRKHRGRDYLCEPDQGIVAPISGIITRVAYPYADKSYSGVEIEGKHLTVKMFYLNPLPSFIRQEVFQGQIIGFAQNIAAKYKDSNMLPHIHLEITKVDPAIFIDMLG